MVHTIMNHHAALDIVVACERRNELRVGAIEMDLDAFFEFRGTADRPEERTGIAISRIDSTGICNPQNVRVRPAFADDAAEVFGIIPVRNDGNWFAIPFPKRRRPGLRYGGNTYGVPNDQPLQPAIALCAQPGARIVGIV